MPIVPIRYKDHWEWASFKGDPYEFKHKRIALKPEIVSWLSQNKARHSLVGNGAAVEAIWFQDPQKAMLFKLTWM
jgi:hypothetical protein